MKSYLITAIVAGGLSVSASAFAQTAGNAAGILGGTPAPRSVTAPSTATAPAGQAVGKGGQVIAIASGAHGNGPAPIVSGAVPQTKDFTSSVTDGTAKIGKGAKGTGEAMQSGVTVSPSGAEKGIASAPGNLARQAGSVGQVVKP